MTASLATHTPAPATRALVPQTPAGILLACPDARPPAYQAAVGFARAGTLDRFVTGVYCGHPARTRKFIPSRARERVRRILSRRHHPEIPPDRVDPSWGFDLALAVENRLAGRLPTLRRRIAQGRTRHFDRLLERTIRRRRPGLAFVFSDVASEFALPACRELGIPTVLSMVHGVVGEERHVIASEAERSPDFFPIYLADGPIDGRDLAWLHERRLRDIELADRVLVPSEHIAARLIEHGTPAGRIRVVPYAADTRRFVPAAGKRHGPSCTFLFAGGITQRKGIKYLLEAWRRVRRPGWRLQLLGGLPADPTPLEPYRDDFELLGRVGHAEVPARMAAADVFVFPSLFEGSAVVTYEALACGLPTITTPSAGSVLRDGVDGFLVPPADVEALAAAVERLGTDPSLRTACSENARSRALEFDWSRYHAALIEATLEAAGAGVERP